MIERADEGRNICVISRQRIVGRTNGSSVYLLSIAEFLKSQGYRLHYLSPTPATFGRWPFLALRRETAVFDSIRIRGSVRLGRILLVLDPSVFWRAALAMLDRLLARFALADRHMGRPAPYAVSVELTEEDATFIARQAPPLADAILLDYAFLTPTIPHVGRPDAPSMVIMHDLFSARGAQFERLGKTDSVAAISQEQEMDLLGKADLVIAIQEEEAEIVRACLPGQAVTVAPCAIEPARQAHPGNPDQLLFVGSRTAPNIDALQWFLADVWPIIQARRASARLAVAGSVTQGCGPAVAGVDYLGIVADLEPLYRDAGVVISPLRVGSGLKVKLIEAFGWGKAVVATPVTLQGIRQLVADCVAVAETAEDFAAATLQLMADDDLRRGRAEQTLELARRHFGPDHCYRGILDFLTSVHDAERWHAARLAEAPLKACGAPSRA
jgi:glycosyltransferase involved in cell wall biosynthesis